MPRYVAVHEAGHAVACWAMQKELGFDWCGFDRVLVRTPDEVRAGPYIDWRGREVDCIGLVEGPSRYNPIGVYYPDMRVVDSGGKPIGTEERATHVEAFRRNMLADVVELMAGPFAEAKYRRRSQIAIILSGGDEDWSYAKRKVADWGKDEDERHAIMVECQKRTSRLLRRPGIWRAVIGLADALLVQRSIEGEEAVAIIEAAENGTEGS